MLNSMDMQNINNDMVLNVEKVKRSIEIATKINMFENRDMQDMVMENLELFADVSLCKVPGYHALIEDIGCEIGFDNVYGLVSIEDILEIVGNLADYIARRAYRLMVYAGIEAIIANVDIEKIESLREAGQLEKVIDAYALASIGSAMVYGGDLSYMARY